MKKSLLLHICCAPDATVSVERLLPGYDITCYFFNPNIHPEEEYHLRLSEAQRLARDMNIPLAWGDYSSKLWMEAVRGLEEEPEGGKRCEVCFSFRLDGTAKYAAQHGFKAFSTVLTVSPHKNADTINKIGSEIGRHYGLEFLCLDLKKKDGFGRSVALSKHYKLYRQNYCGCLFSKTKRK